MNNARLCKSPDVYFTDSADTEVQSNVNLCLSLILHPASMPGGSAEVGNPNPSKYSYHQEMKYEVHTISFQTFFVRAFKIGVDSWKFSKLLLYIL